MENKEKIIKRLKDLQDTYNENEIRFGNYDWNHYWYDFPERQKPFDKLVCAYMILLCKQAVLEMTISHTLDLPGDLFTNNYGRNVPENKHWLLNRLREIDEEVKKIQAEVKLACGYNPNKPDSKQKYTYNVKWKYMFSHNELAANSKTLCQEFQKYIKELIAEIEPL